MVQTSNVKRFLAAIGRAEERGAGEAGWVVAAGEPGLGKTKVLEWWAVRNKAAYLRAKADWSAHWLYHELAQAVGADPEGTKKTLFGRILAEIGGRQIAIVIDEVEKTKHNPKLLEAVRDFTDLTEVILVLGGTPSVQKFLERDKAWSSRKSAEAVFEKATIEDVGLMVQQLSEVEIAPDLLPRILTDSNGYYREIKNAIATLERVGKLNPGRPVTPDDVKGVQLCHGRRPAEARR